MLFLTSQEIGVEDRSFLDAFHRRDVERFSHRDHLRLAWIILKVHGPGEGSNIIRHAIRDFAKDKGAGNLYHETLTTFWAQLVHHAIQTRPDIRGFDELLATLPLLLDKNLPLKHWSSELLWSNPARTVWVEPDLLPLSA